MVLANLRDEHDSFPHLHILAYALSDNSIFWWIRIYIGIHILGHFVIDFIYIFGVIFIF